MLTVEPRRWGLVLTFAMMATILLVGAAWPTQWPDVCECVCGDMYCDIGTCGGTRDCASANGCGGYACPGGNYCPSVEGYPCGGDESCANTGCEADDCSCVEYCPNGSIPCDGICACSAACGSCTCYSCLGPWCKGAQGCHGAACPCGRFCKRTGGYTCGTKPQPCAGTDDCGAIYCNCSLLEDSSGYYIAGCPQCEKVASRDNCNGTISSCLAYYTQCTMISTPNPMMWLCGDDADVECMRGCCARVKSQCSDGHHCECYGLDCDCPSGHQCSC